MFKNSFERSIPFLNALVQVKVYRCSSATLAKCDLSSPLVMQKAPICDGPGHSIDCRVAGSSLSLHLQTARPRDVCYRHLVTSKHDPSSCHCKKSSLSIKPSIDIPINGFSRILAGPRSSIICRVFQAEGVNDRVGGRPPIFYHMLDAKPRCPYQQ